MNNPLRFAGETFYQSNYGRDARTGIEYTGLQVVTNTGWRIPYVSCMMMAVGMLAQFWDHVGPIPAATCRAATGQPRRRPAATSRAGRGRRSCETARCHGPAAATASLAAWAVPLAVVVRADCGC